MAEICSACGAATLSKRLAPFEFSHEGRIVSIDDWQTYCEVCHNVSYVDDQFDLHQSAIAEKIRKIDNLLTPLDLLRIRGRYGFSQPEMEKLLSIGPKTWTRWERGKVTHTKATDLVIRRMDEDPRFVRDLMKLRQVRNEKILADITRAELNALQVASFQFKRMPVWFPHQIDAVKATQAIIESYEQALRGNIGQSGVVNVYSDVGLYMPQSSNIFDYFNQQYHAVRPVLNDYSEVISSTRSIYSQSYEGLKGPKPLMIAEELVL